MKRTYIAGSAVGLLMLLAGCSDTPAPPPDTSAADQKALRDGEETWVKEWAAKDADKIAAHYADDATLALTDMPLVKGRDSIRTTIKGFLADKNLALSFTPSNVALSKGGDLAYTQGSYSITQTNAKTKKAEVEKGKYVTVYKKQADGAWKVVADIDNRDAPAAPVAGAKSAKTAKKAAPAAHRKKKK